MDQPNLAATNPPSKTPVVRGARACTVCRAAKMKCVGAEDGTKPCQRCQRSGAQCVFEKHRRGRKPGSKLSEASKMLRRLEKGLNNAKAKQPTNPALSQPSSSAAQFSQDDAPASSFSPTANNASHSGQQSDDDMDEDEDGRPEEAFYPVKLIRSSFRSSFLDVVMNPEPAEHTSSRPLSDSPTDRSPPQPKAPSQSPTRSDASPQPKPYSGLFPSVPKDPVAAGIVPQEDVQMFFDAFFLRLNPFINLFDPVLHSPNYVRSRSPFLFTAMLMACCKFFRPASYQPVRRLAHEWCIYAFAEGTESVETVQALACMTYWKEPHDRRTWTFIGMACRMAVNLRLNRYVGGRQINETDVQMLERRNRERTYLVLFVHDRSLSMQTGKHWMLQEDELVRRSRNWHEEGALGQRPDTRPEDVIVAAFVHLRLIGSEGTDTFYNRSNLFENELHKYNSKLDEWVKFWIAQMRKSPLADPFHTAFLMFFQSHVRLFLNTFGLNMSNLETTRLMPNAEAVRQCCDSARNNLQIVSKDFAGMHVLLQRYGQESITVMSAYAAVVLLKLLRSPSTMVQLTDSAEDVHRLINETADAYQSAGHVTGSEMDSAAFHARFLRRITDMDQERVRTERNGHRSDGPFSQGLPPIRATQPMGVPVSHLDTYSLSRPAPQPQLAPLAIPGSSMNCYSSSVDPTGMESSMRNGLSQSQNNRGPSYCGTHASESDDSYFQYILGEVGVAGETLFPRADGSPSSAIGYMSNGSGVTDMAFPASSLSNYREPPPLPFGGHAHSRAGSYHHLPPMQSYGSSSFDR